MRVLVMVALVSSLVTGCAAQARKPAMIVGGALAIGGIALSVGASNRSCDSGDLGEDWNCAGQSMTGWVVGLVMAGIGTGVLVGAMLGGDSDETPASSPLAPLAPLAPLEPLAAEAPTPRPDPANPPPAMEPEPAQW